MGVCRILGAGVGLLTLVLAAPAAAIADAPLNTSGALVYSWHGDPTRGCARIGVCGIQGTLIVAPQYPAFLFAAPKASSGSIDISGDGSATVRVRRTEAGSSGDCLDTNVWPNAGDGSLQVKWTRAGRATLILPRVDGPSSGHCAGPLSGQLPTRIAGRRLPGRNIRFAFRDTTDFVAGPYSGSLVSTLGFAPDTSEQYSSGGGSGSSPGRSPTLLDERVVLTYRIAIAPATLRATLLGERDPFCLELDSCATDGALAMSVGSRRATITVSADRIVRHRAGRARALADFRARRLLLNIPFPGPTGPISSAETLSRSQGATCTASSPQQRVTAWLGSPFAPPPFIIGANGPVPVPPHRQARRIPVLLTIEDPANSLRTDCAGPTAADVFGADGVLGRGAMAFGQLLHSRTTVTLHPTARYSAPGYFGSISGSLTVTMSLIKVRAGTIKVPA